ncbi:MAG TPA: ATP-binding protein [Gemmataceae bacterium]|nr:ATP-binding protein [Gemmataceae bacterium]
MTAKAIVSWSGGKDSALALWEARGDFEIVALLTTVTEGYDRVSMHGVRTSLLERQAESLGYPVAKVVIPSACGNADYEHRMRAALERYRQAGVSAVICGDIFLEEVRRYREERLFTAGLRGVFPLWHRDTAALARHFLALGFRAVLCCVDTNVLAPDFAGRLYDTTLLAGLPLGADPCGENGEFHSFVFDGPGFARPVGYMVGERTLRDNRFCYCDLIPAPAIPGDRADEIAL